MPDLKPLYEWFRREYRNLPFRRNRNAYRVWIAETMLQQTRVKAMERRYGEFMKEFPNLRSLAVADEERVLHAWRGLGYYGRARNLHRAARMICSRHNGRFPRNEKDLLALPGVGEYTMSAVLSICFDRALPVLDGNVRRVLGRMESPAVEGDGSGRRELMELARRWMAACGKEKPGLHNESLMELGALICTPVNPSCELCPLAGQCSGRGAIQKTSSSGKRAGKSRIPLTVRLYVITDTPGKRVWLIRDGRQGFYRNLWIFPSERFGPSPSTPERTETPVWPEGTPLSAVGRTIGLPVGAAKTRRRKKGSAAASFRHSLLNYNLHVDIEFLAADRIGFDMDLPGDDGRSGPVEWKLLPWGEVDRLMIASLGRKAYQKIRELNLVP